MFEKKDGLKFKAKIRIGASIGQDFGWATWPDLPHPKNIDPDMVFDCTELHDHRFEAVAPHFGVLGKGDRYGNGSLYIFSINDLVVEPSIREKALESIRKQKRSRLKEIEADADKLRAEIETIQ